MLHKLTFFCLVLSALTACEQKKRDTSSEKNKDISSITPVISQTNGLMDTSRTVFKSSDFHRTELAEEPADLYIERIQGVPAGQLPEDVVALYLGCLTINRNPHFYLFGKKTDSTYIRLQAVPELNHTPFDIRRSHNNWDNGNLYFSAVGKNDSGGIAALYRWKNKKAFFLSDESGE
jgi:hypothetical protein